MILPTCSVAFFCAIAAVAHAQPAYRLGSDTLRYEERTDAQVTMQVGANAVVVRTEHEATIGVVLRATATGWYEQLRLRQEGPGARVQAPSTDAVLRKPFSFRFSPRGHVTLESAPPLPPEISGITDLTRQFDDFFVTLPPTALKAGVSWADTVLKTTPGRPQDTYRAQHVRRYRVERDTTIGGAPAFVVSIAQSVTIDATSPMEGQPGQVTGHLEGEEEGSAVLPADGARLIARHRTGNLKGTMRMPGPTGEMAIPQTYVYESVIQLRGK